VGEAIANNEHSEFGERAFADVESGLGFDFFEEWEEGTHD
jgi:hypothetical protein